MMNDYFIKVLDAVATILLQLIALCVLAYICYCGWRTMQAIGRGIGRIIDHCRYRR